MFITVPTSHTLNPSTFKIVSASAPEVPLVVDVQLVDFVVAVVLIILAGAINSPLALTGSSYANPIRLYGLFSLYLLLVTFSLLPCLIIPCSKSVHKLTLVEL